MYFNIDLGLPANKIPLKESLICESIIFIFSWDIHAADCVQWWIFHPVNWTGTKPPLKTPSSKIGFISPLTLESRGLVSSPVLPLKTPIGWSFFTMNCHRKPSFAAEALLFRHSAIPWSLSGGWFMVKDSGVSIPTWPKAQNPASPPTAALLWIWLSTFEIQNTLEGFIL